MTDDSDLLRRYTEEKSEAAFAELVRRYLDLVYAVALRKVGGDAHLAEDVAQQVFADLAKKAAALARHPVLTGWLFTSAHYAATQVVRAEQRRRVREAKAHAMSEIEREVEAAPDWNRLRPLLDDLVHELNERDREAVLLRYFEGRSLAEVGERLEVSAEGARSRVDRAVEKLRATLARRGVRSTAAALGLALAGQVGVAAPAGLAASATVAALAGVEAGSVGINFMNMIKPMVVPVGVGAGVALVVTIFLAQGRANAAWREEITTLRHQESELARLETENGAMTRAAVEVAVWRQDDAELARLRDEAGALRERMKRVAKAEVPRATVSGQIRMPGYYNLPQEGRMTLAALLAKCGGLTDLGNPHKIRVARLKTGEANRIFVLNIETDDGAFALEPGDMVYVPERII